MEDIKILLGKKAIEFKAIPFRDCFITGLNYAYKTEKNRYYFYCALSGQRYRISQKRYTIINQCAEVL